MLKYYIKTTEALKALKRLATDKRGVVSFEYVIVAACIVAAVAVAFGGTGAGSITQALKDSITAVAGKVTAAVNNTGPVTPATP